MGRSARSRGRARRERKTAEPYRHFDDRHPTKGNGGSARTGKGESRGGEHAQIFFPRQHQPRNTHSPQRHCRLFLAAGVGGKGDFEEKQEYINIIENNNTLLLQLISDVLDLSKIEAGTMEFDYAPIDVHGLFIELEDTFRLRNKKSGICICYHRRTTECVVKADRNRLVQVMMNLMNNAVKFTGEGSIEFGFDVREDGFLHFYVTDTGCGIPEERLEEIFGNFVKLNSFVQGTGLGLTICRAIVERMGGKIGAVSRLGQGSTFWFTLPYTANEEKV